MHIAAAAGGLATRPRNTPSADWLVASRCTHAAMESTGTDWKPVFNLLESVCKARLVNARDRR